ncbi:hypothetical protein ACF09H_21990 [Streptomyces sp. NPDC014983]|uniref:hypothetical protein n=1 Tax=Streptomyces sp. NPDC014983 TaxID=3364933 RepID=UPI0036F82998
MPCDRRLSPRHPTPTRSRESPITHRTTLVDRDARYLQAARRGALSAVTEYGAVRYLVDRSGKFRSYLGAPPPALFTAGLLRYRGDGVSLELTSAGSAALDAYLTRKTALDALPYTLTRNPLREELHRADEPIRILRQIATGREIAPGATLTDPSGHPVTYLGPTMSSDDRGATWRPTFTARVSYPDHGGWLYPPAALGAAYDAEQVAPGTREPG